jgi:GNAT superfamily N-acetyltransferase
MLETTMIVTFEDDMPKASTVESGLILKRAGAGTIRKSTLLRATVAGTHAGATFVVLQCSECSMAAGSNQIALVWDLRVASAYRRRGVGSALLKAAEDWARLNGAAVIKAETQGSNSTATAFCLKREFRLQSVTSAPHVILSDDLEMEWYKPLVQAAEK